MTVTRSSAMVTVAAGSDTDTVAGSVSTNRASPSASRSLLRTLMLTSRPGRTVTESGTAVGLWFCEPGGAMPTRTRARPCTPRRSSTM